MKVRAPRVNDRRDEQSFSSRILPPFMRGSPRLEEALPVLYLRGLSTGDFVEALPVLLGPDAAGLSATTITRLTQIWQDEYVAWRKRSLAGTDYVYIWADGVYFNVRLEEDRLACLAIMGVRADGTKEIIALEDGYRESQESWASLLRDLRRRGMPALAVGDVVGLRQPPGRAFPPCQPAPRPIQLQTVCGTVHDRIPVVQEASRHVVVEAEGRRDVLARDGAHAARGGHHVVRGNRPTVGEGGRNHAAASATELHEVCQQVGADVHHPVAAVVPLATGTDIS